MTWSEEPTIELISGNLGNRLYQFFAAQTLIDQVGKGTVSNLDLSEWGLRFPKKNVAHYREVIVIDRIAEFDIPLLAERISSEPSLYIKNRSHLQEQLLCRSPEIYRRRFPIIGAVATVCTDEELLINIRTGDILAGKVPHYPLMPIAFYQFVVAETGLKPVFIGQLDDSVYISNLREAFPEAKFIQSRGPINDFDTIRSAKNILPAISTFSLAAAWLSKATNIFLPLNGFLNPAHMREINLLPVNDHRYRFFLFPMNYAVPEEEALRHHLTLHNTWKEISPKRVEALQRDAPLIRVPPGFHDTVVAGFNEHFYIHKHLDAAIDVSNGWYENGLHHYVDIGRRLGYEPGPLGRYDPQMPNLALNRPAWQSSKSPWSRGRGNHGDAMRAVNGDRAKDLGNHTGTDNQPWWIVDCECQFVLQEIRIFNRKGEIVLQRRADPLLVEASEDMHTWFVGSSDQGGAIVRSRTSLGRPADLPSRA